MGMAYWLMKSEPAEFGLSHLLAQHSACWDGVRNYQARNFIRQMQAGDLALLYHSGVKPAGIAGIMRIQTVAYPDPTQFMAGHRYADASADPQAPRWSAVTVELVAAWADLLPLSALRDNPALAGFALLNRGNRLSVMPVLPAQWQAILAQAAGMGLA